MSNVSCNWVREHVALFAYGELSMEQEEQVQAHTAGCAGCQGLLERERRLHSLLDDNAEVVPASLLVECRRGLQASLTRQAQVQPSWWRRAADWFGADAWVWKPVAAGALVALGFSGAKWHTQYELAQALSAAPPAEVRLLKSSPDGQVELAYDVAQRKVVRGHVADPSIRALLLRAANESNDVGTRSRTVEALASADTEQVRDTLQRVARMDPDAQVRAKAVVSLRPHMNEQSTRRVLVEVLRTDGDERVRGQVIELFGQRLPGRFDPEVIGVLQELSGRDANGAVRAKAQRVLFDNGASPYVF